MAVKHNQINLLPTRWKTPTKLSDLQKRLQLVSLIILGIYVTAAFLILGWLGFLKVRETQIASATEATSAQLAKYRHVEAAQELLKEKAALGVSEFKDKINAGVALDKGARLFADTLQPNQLSVDSKGKFELTGTASGSAGAVSATALVENPQGEGRNLFSQGLATLGEDKQGKITITFNLQFLPNIPTVNLAQ